MPFLAFLAGPLGKYVIYAAIALGAVLVLLGLKHGYDEGKRDEGRAEVQADWDADKKRASEAAAAVARQYGAALAQVDELQAKVREQHAQVFEPIKRRAVALPAAVAAVRVPADAVRVLNDAVAAGNGEAAGAAGKPEQARPAAAADTDTASLTGWGVQVIELYDQCRQQVEGWQTFYSRLRAATEGNP